MIDRRTLLALMGAAAAAPTWAAEPGVQLGEARAFSPELLAQRAREMAARPYAARPAIPQPWQDLTYDQYRKIWFDSRNALWEGTDRPQRVDVFPPAFISRGRWRCMRWRATRPGR